MKPVAFHWMLIQSDETKAPARTQKYQPNVATVPDMANQIDFCKRAVTAGIEGLLVDLSYAKPDPLLLAAHLAAQTKKIKFIVAIRSGMLTPTYFVQQINTFSATTNGRILLNIVAGHSPKTLGYYGDFLPHDKRYARTEEFLNICNSFWQNKFPIDFKGAYYEVRQATLQTPFVASSRKSPYTFVAGGSNASRHVAIQEGDCWMRFPNTTEKMATEIAPVIAMGKEVGLRMAVVIRPTKAAAIAAVHNVINTIKNKQRVQQQERNSVEKGDSVSFKQLRKMEDWLNPWIWTGTVKVMGPAAIAFVGTPSEFADMVMTYKKMGITQYILSGWPNPEEMTYFGKEVLPLIRNREQH